MFKPKNITPHYDSLFRLPDGRKVRISYPNGGVSKRTCRYIDETHVEIGSNIYHICEFAELMERTGATVKPYDVSDDNTKEEA